MSSVARRYAQILVEMVTDQKNDLDCVGEELAFVTRTITKNKALMKIIHHPRLSIADKENLITDILSPTSLLPITREFLFGLIRMNRLNMLANIEKKYVLLVNIQQGRIKIVITSALPLLEDEKIRLKETISKIITYKLYLEFNVDSTVLGGIIIRIHDKIIDGSIKTQLERLRMILYKNSTGVLPVNVNDVQEGGIYK